MPTSTFYPAVDGAIRRYTGSETWQQAHDASTGTDVYDTANPTSVCASYSSLGLVTRGFFSFDTSSLPDGAEITSATLTLTGSASVTGTNGSVELVSNSQSSNTALSSGDYNKLGTTAYATGINLTSWTVGANVFTLNSTGRAAISTTGYTLIGVRHSSDLNNSNPSSDNAVPLYFSEQSGTGSDPVLSVTYTTTRTTSDAWAWTDTNTVSGSGGTTFVYVRTTSDAWAWSDSTTPPGARTAGTRRTIWTAGTAGTFGAHYAFGSVVRTNSTGGLLAVARKATSHNGYDGDLVAKVSSDDGASWGTEFTLVSTAYDERDPKLLRLANGDIAMTWQQRRNYSGGRYYPRFSRCSGDVSTLSNWTPPVTVVTKDTLEVYEPTGYSGGSVPLLVIFHAAGGTASSPFGTGDSVIADAQAAGYLCIAANAQDRAWGNDVSVGSYLAAIAYAKQHYTVTRTVFWAASMGGLPALTLASRRVISDLKGLLLVYPVCSLADFYTDKSSYRTEIDTAYQASSGQGATVAASENCDPYLQTTSLYSGLRFMFLASSSDTVVSKAHNTDYMHAKVNSVATESSVTTTTGDHGDASNWDWSLYSAFLGRCT